jgi:hypothetical protein
MLKYIYCISNFHRRKFFRAKSHFQKQHCSVFTNKVVKLLKNNNVNPRFFDPDMGHNQDTQFFTVLRPKGLGERFEK